MSHSLLKEMLEQGYVVFKKHPEADLFIYNYSAKTQYERIWNEITLACRGLILDAEGNFVARPFAKFFNLFPIFSKLYLGFPIFQCFECLGVILGRGVAKLLKHWKIGTPK